MTETPEDVAHKLDALAGVVRSELVAAGLPVVPEDHPLGTAGAVVQVDRPDLHGVTVDWRPHPIVVDAGQAAWAEDPMKEGEECAAFRALFEGVSEAMGTAMRQILTLAGLEVRSTGNDYAPHELLVTRRLAVSPWRARHDATFTRRYDAMREGWRRHHEQERRSAGS